MAFSSKTVTYTGGPQVFNIAFALGVLETAHLSVQVVGNVDGFGDPVEYAFNYDPNTGDVTVTDLLEVDDVVFIQRVTPIDTLLVDFEAGADVSRRNVSRAVKQAIMVAQEVVDAREADRTTVADLDAAFTALESGIAADVATAEVSADIASAAAASAAASAAEAAARENSLLEDAGNWVTATVYTPSQIYTFGGSAYITLVAHTSTSVAADVAGGKVRIFAAKGDSGPGSGDMLNSANLSGLTNKPLAVTNLGFTLSAAKIVESVVPAGTVIFTAGASAPTGWLKADGSAVSRTTYADLFAVCGTTYGAGNGSTTFNLPDLRGEFIRGWADGRAVDTGRVRGSAQSDDNKEHSHGVTDPGHFHTVANTVSTVGIQDLQGSGSNPARGAVSRNTDNKTTGITVNSSGGTEARPRNIALLACIKF